MLIRGLNLGAPHDTKGRDILFFTAKLLRQSGEISQLFLCALFLSIHYDALFFVALVNFEWLCQHAQQRNTANSVRNVTRHPISGCTAAKKSGGKC